MKAINIANLKPTSIARIIADSDEEQALASELFDHLAGLVGLFEAIELVSIEINRS